MTKIPPQEKVSKIVERVMENRKAVETLHELHNIVYSELKKDDKEYVITAKRLKGIAREIKNIRIKAKTKKTSKVGMRKKCPICDNAISDSYAVNLAGKKIKLGYKCKKCGFNTTSREIIPMRYTFIWKSQ